MKTSLISCLSIFLCKYNCFLLEMLTCRVCYNTTPVVSRTQSSSWPVPTPFCCITFYEFYKR